MYEIRKLSSLFVSLALGISVFSVAMVANAANIRYDFTNDTEGVQKAGGISNSIAAVDGVAVVTATNTTGTNNNVGITLPSTDLGDGGYYMYVKVKYDLPDTTTNRWSAVQYACRQENGNFPPSANFTNIYTTNADKSWSDYKIIQVDTRELTDSKEIQLRFVTRQSEPSGEVKLYVDWVVFSQSSTAPSEPGVLSPDIRYDFTNDTEGVQKAGGISNSIAAVDGVAVVTATNTTGSNNNVGITLPSTDLGEGGYYMYAKVKYDLPDPATNRWSAVQYACRQENGNFPTNFTNIYTTNADKSWSDYKIIQVDTRELTDSKEIQLRFVTRQTEPSGEVKLYVDWVVFSQSSTAPEDMDETVYDVVTFDEVANVVSYDDVTGTYSKAFELGYANLSEYNTFFVKIDDEVKGQSLGALGLDGYDGTVMLGIIINDLPTDSAVQVGFTTQTIE